MKYRAFILLLSFLPAVHAYAQADSLTVIGTVVNGVDDNVLPLCKVHLIKDGICWASGISDYDGNYSLPPVVAGDYTFLVTQFGDTLMCVRGLRLSRNTMVRSVIQPPTGGFSTLPAISVGGLVQLRPVSVSARKNLLYGLGLLITSPNDHRLWNFSGQIEFAGDASEDFSGGRASAILASLFLVCPGLEVSWKNSDMKNELLLYGRILDVFIPAPADTVSKKD
jgi:hypothetical protein